ncbi:Por secretion system C-terminal sorting domain-containing protein [Hydrobacter penzbergensis]|uniref:Por secretion system C-terminal sorting domain-containing protein n=1 Tax=Hydrobacter penzbergensis TaxID=1235997 RepID=A0A8X8LE43_9BACT|nr:T9SS type A sorting domain-containing protein [Hydrobacter penzbergensis]SDX11201.1 Por secretion system C-terminal sorting domain-containing protein [Hydrobacter penzbergensis]
MKTKILLTTLLWLTVMQIRSQSIVPNQTSEVCPGVDIVFTVTIPGTLPSVSSKALNVNPVLIQGPSNVTTSGGSTTFNFTGRFADFNNKQTFTVNYTDGSGLSASWDATFPKIKSLFFASQASVFYPAPSSITAPRCQSQNFNISFPNIQYGNPYEAPQISYGTVTNYQYLLPTGWSMNGTVSNGSNWINGSNNVTVTSNLSNGDGSGIRIRPVNTACAPGLATGQEASVAISRPAPRLSVTSSPSYICTPGGTASVSISGLPAGANVSWSSSNAGLPIVGSNTGSTITVQRIGSSNGEATITATVTHCTFTYTVSQAMSFGAGAPPSITLINADKSCGTFLEAYCTNPVNSTGFIWNFNFGQVIQNNPGYYGDYFLLKPLNQTTTGQTYYDYLSVVATTPCGNSDPSPTSSITIGPITGSCSGRIVRTPPQSLTATASEENVSEDRLFPNPVNSVLKLQVKTKNVGKYAMILDASGRILQRIKLVNTITQVDVSKLQGGTYFIKIPGEANKPLKFIK